MTAPTDFVEIVPPTEPPLADEAFQRWAHDRHDAGATWTDEDVRVDTIRARDGRTLRRYLVRRGVVDGAG